VRKVLTQSGVAISLKCFLFPHGVSVRGTRRWFVVHIDHSHRQLRKAWLKPNVHWLGGVGQLMCDILFCISWPANHNMHHRASTDSACDIGFLFSWPDNNMHHRTTTDSKITRCISHISPDSVRFVDVSRRQLTTVFDKPAFSRFSQNCEPLLVVDIFGKIVKRPAVGNSPPFLTNLPFHDFLKTVNH